ncbi:S41 family peptidase [Marinicella sp. W31]|uniref:S41 family peptidase n=1 Tax=Marinicella sp. W31 TaxID=3023713 RepID=UPI003757AD11
MKNIICLTLSMILQMIMATALSKELLTYQPEQMQADLVKFKTAIEKIHPGTFTHQSPEKFDTMFKKLLLETSKPMEAQDFYKIVLKLVANIHDGHTQAYAFGLLGNQINNLKRLPFQVHVRNQRIFITKNMSSQKIAEGSELLSLDGHLSHEILVEILKHYSSDGKSHNGLFHWLGGPYKAFNRLYPEIYGQQEKYTLVYRDYQSNKIVETQISPITESLLDSIASEKYPPNKTTTLPFSFEINTQNDFAILTIKRFFKDSYDEPENTYPDFFKKSFAEISKHGIQNLIIDLRDNGGGKASNAAYLLKYFIKEPLTPAKKIYALGNDAYYFDLTGKKLDLNAYFKLKAEKNGTFQVTESDVLRDLKSYQPIQKNPYADNLIVLINGGTASAAGIAAGLLKEHTHAVLVGEETYGYAGISNGVRQISIKGDHTETAVYLPILHAEYTLNKHVQKRSVVPDYQVLETIQNVLEGNDSIMEFAVENLFTRKRQ